MGSDLGIAEMYIHANTKIVQVRYARKHGRYFMESWLADKFDTVNIRSFKTVWPEK